MLSIQTGTWFEHRGNSGDLQTLTSQNTVYPFSLVLPPCISPHLKTGDDDIEGKGKIGPPYLLFPFRHSLFIRKPNVMNISRMCAYQK